MKKVLLTLIAVVLCLVLTGCSNNTQDIKSELRGTWMNDTYDKTFGYHIYKTYKFTLDGVEMDYRSGTDSWTIKGGTYEIKDGKILISFGGRESSYYSGLEALYAKQGTNIEYTYNNGNLRLFDKGPNNNIEDELIRK